MRLNTRCRPYRTLCGLIVVINPQCLGTQIHLSEFPSTLRFASLECFPKLDSLLQELLQLPVNPNDGAFHPRFPPPNKRQVLTGMWCSVHKSPELLAYVKNCNQSYLASHHNAPSYIPWISWWLNREMRHITCRIKLLYSFAKHSFSCEVVAVIEELNEDGSSE